MFLIPLLFPSRLDLFTQALLTNLRDIDAQALGCLIHVHGQGNVGRLFAWQLRYGKFRFHKIPVRIKGGGV